MMMWLGILAAVLIAAGLGTVYMTAAVGRYGFVRKLSGEKRWLRNLISFGIIAVLTVAVGFAMSAVNAVIVFLHFVLSFLMFGLIARIAKAVKGKDKDDDEKEQGFYWQGILAPFFTVVYLAVGYYLLHGVWQTNYNLTTDKQIGTIRIAMFADSHIGTTFDGEGFAKHIETIKAQSPDIVLVPGDFVDDGTNREDMERACEALGTIDAKYGVWFCYGNHDAGYYNSRGFSSNELEDALERNGVRVLKDEYENVGDKLCVVGRNEGYKNGERKDIGELLIGADTERYIIVLDHIPNDYDNESKSCADLVVSGHTHGGQLLPITFVGEWIGANDKTYGYERRNGTDFIVTSGISDWEILFKTGTKSEYVIIDVSQK